MKLICIGSSSKGNAYALVHKNEILLLEAGCPMWEVKKAINWKISHVVGCVITHQHGDHIGKIVDYCKEGFPIYSSDETAKHIEDVYGEKIIGVTEFQCIGMGGFVVQPFKLPHNGIPNFGYLIEHEAMGKLLFMTDMEFCPYDFSGLSINHLVIEANYDMELVDTSIPNYAHKLLGHCSIQTACGIIEKNCTPGLRNVVLCHLGAFSDEIDFRHQAMRACGGLADVGVADKRKEFDLSKEPF